MEYFHVVLNFFFPPSVCVFCAIINLSLIKSSIKSTLRQKYVENDVDFWKKMRKDKQVVENKVEHEDICYSSKSFEKRIREDLEFCETIFLNYVSKKVNARHFFFFFCCFIGAHN